MQYVLLYSMCTKVLLLNRGELKSSLPHCVESFANTTVSYL